MTQVRRALLSVTHKQGIADFARALVELGVEIISTGGTAALLEKSGIPVIPLEKFTGSPEMLDGRVKTLHPRVHGGILARRELASHREEVALRGLDYIDLVAVNLYDFDGTVSKPGATFEEILENIDIGGPTLLRAAAKNHPSVIPVVDPDDYPRIIDALRTEQPLDRRLLALKVYRETSRYDRAVSAWLERTIQAEKSDAHPQILERSYRKLQELRYGENPHQTAAFYVDAGGTKTGLAATEQLQGKELSYNNLLDLDSALGLILDLEGDAAAVFIKHNNPCGVATGATLAQAIATARACDPVSAFGAVIAVNREVDERATEVLTEAFIEAVIAPSYTPGALALFAKKANVRVLRLAGADHWKNAAGGTEVRQIRGGALLQTRDVRPRMLDELEGARVVTRRSPTPEERRALAFTWAIAKHVRSNAIVFGHADRVVAVGAGQMSRVDSVKLCTLKAGDALKGTVVASDAFFPFRDGVDVLAAAGASAIVQPGGSIRDAEVIAAADEHGVAMMFTGVRHFRH